MNEPAVLAEELGGSPLSRALRGGELPAEWFTLAPGSHEAWRLRMTATRSINPGWATTLRAAIQPRGRAAERLARAANGGVLVTTGQQPGLFGGALYTLFKALSADAIARTLERETGIPTAPLFWAATDDADFEEASAVQIATAAGCAVLRAPDRPPPGTPMAAAPIGDVRPLLDQLVAQSGSLVGAATIEQLSRTYGPTATVGSAYVGFLREALEPFGIAVLDASHPSVAETSAPILRRALERAADLERAVHERSVELRKRGYPPQVEEVPGLALVFGNEAGIKRRLTVQESAQAPGSHEMVLTPTVLLRPIVEQEIVPTVAYVGGPGEMAYFAQSSAVADVLGVAPPLVVPRWSGTIIEPRVARILARLDIDQVALRDVDALLTRLARAQLPDGIAGTLASLRADIDRAIARLGAVEQSGLISPRVLEGGRIQLLHRVDRLERRYVAAVKRQSDDLTRNVMIARGSLYPDGIRQERMLAFAQFMARYGDPLVDELIEATTAHAERLAGASQHSRPTVASSS
jgi:bacillithiol biosynthesis cysteine-adding enzyme BshC